MKPDLDAVLFAYYNLDLCYRVDCGQLVGPHLRRAGDVGPLIGILDWRGELLRLLGRER